MPQSHPIALGWFIKRLTSRSVLSDDEQSVILNLRGRLAEIDSHVDIVPLGEHLKHSYLVVEGIVGRFGENFDGLRQITCLYIPGDMADLSALVVPKPAWGLAALTRTTILSIPHADLKQIASNYPNIAEALWRDSIAEGSIFAEWVINVGRRNARTRVAHLICEVAIRYEKAGHGSRNLFPFAMTQADIADATGLTSVHVNRTLKTLRSEVRFSTQNKMATVDNWANLASIGEFNQSYLLLNEPLIEGPRHYGGRMLS